jgi:uncharacterized Zn finger protein
MKGNLACPACGSDEVLGHEISSVYDGVLFWSCNECGHGWARDWTGFGSRQQAADERVADWNAAQGWRATS